MRKKVFFLIALIVLAVVIAQGLKRYFELNRVRVLTEIVKRLESESKIAEVIVTKSNYNPLTKQTETTIKLLEYDYLGRPLSPKYFSFPGNLIQFQSLVVRFDDVFVRKKDILRGKSIHLLWKVFYLSKESTIEYEIAKINEIPAGFKIGQDRNPFELQIWTEFWRYALNAKFSPKAGIKNAQIEAPGTVFVPGFLYTIKIEHDGGLRIDARPLPKIVIGEQIL
ncbi:MAG: hypothetical protein PHV17_05640 [Candidatus Omnitrophica bacterium]|nr:hypothetical protein [Candidatus Omnitrophota bacterium]